MIIYKFSPYGFLVAMFLNTPLHEMADSKSIELIFQ